jgi:hypothetical protein
MCEALSWRPESEEVAVAGGSGFRGGIEAVERLSTRVTWGMCQAPLQAGFWLTGSMLGAEDSG